MQGISAWAWVKHITIVYVEPQRQGPERLPIEGLGFRDSGGLGSRVQGLGLKENGWCSRSMLIPISFKFTAPLCNVYVVGLPVPLPWHVSLYRTIMIEHTLKF